MIRDIISYFSVFTLLVAVLNIILSVIVYYCANSYAYKFKKYRWYISFVIILIFIARRNIVIN